ncbi:hypothetical protein C8F04DRAFT_1299230 [Mycena alexandri]|uniref:Uncharacterized protein n=1 Tax=Mycena alexandri TaxID=1745969 RepID=A0AAD6T8G1_9AGAR|nr:hypothetical protein C8F04DRAFT_1299230 [Mycena alexandri]
MVHAPDGATFPFLHGLEGGNVVQNTFFAGPDDRNSTGAFLNTNGGGGKRHPPRFRGLGVGGRIWEGDEYESDDEEVEIELDELGVVCAGAVRVAGQDAGPPITTLEEEQDAQGVAKHICMHPVAHRTRPLPLTTPGADDGFAAAAAGDVVMEIERTLWHSGAWDALPFLGAGVPFFAYSLPLQSLRLSSTFSARLVESSQDKMLAPTSSAALVAVGYRRAALHFLRAGARYAPPSPLSLTHAPSRVPYPYTCVYKETAWIPPLPLIARTQRHKGAVWVLWGQLQDGGAASSTPFSSSSNPSASPHSAPSRLDTTLPRGEQHDGAANATQNQDTTTAPHLEVDANGGESKNAPGGDKEQEDAGGGSPLLTCTFRPRKLARRVVLGGGVETADEERSFGMSLEFGGWSLEDDEGFAAEANERKGGNSALDVSRLWVSLLYIDARVTSTCTIHEDR